MMTLYRPKTINKAIDDLEEFLQADMWHCFEEEFKSESDMCEYLADHFKILRNQINYIKKKKRGNK